MIINAVIQNLLIKGYLEDVSVISLSLREAYAREYALLSNGDFDSLSLSNKKYALKLAGLNLQKIIDSKYSGLIYCISNPCFPKHVKIGITNNVIKRLSSYQTYDPHRSFRIECYRFVFDKRLVEKTILSMYKANLDLGEWVSDLSVIDYVKSLK